MTTNRNLLAHMLGAAAALTGGDGFKITVPQAPSRLPRIGKKPSGTAADKRAAKRRRNIRKRIAK